MSERLESPEEAATRLARESLTAQERAELWQRIETRSSGLAFRRRLARATFGGVAIAVAMTAMLQWLHSMRRPLAHRTQPAIGNSAPALRGGAIGNSAPALRGGAMTGSANACALDAAAHDLQLPAHCATTALQLDGDEWQLEAGAHVARVEGGAQVVDGRVRFRVSHREAQSFRVQVSHGEVQVIGTVFTIEQHADHGSIAVSEGVIEFVWRDGTRERVASGARLAWPRRTDIAPPRSAGTMPATDAATEQPAKAAHIAAAKPKAKDGGQTSLDLDPVMERLLQLRSQKRFGEAVALLRSTLSGRSLSLAARERLSYELGLTLEAGGEPSCAHWRQHVARFGDERHAAGLSERLARCARGK